jgi:hypothetical protein
MLHLKETKKTTKNYPFITKLNLKIKVYYLDDLLSKFAKNNKLKLIGEENFCCII